uniref:Uncharacterized protein n=1 Tax=Anguilla anguilla TaxID=7936 RepID=A0A0E9PZ01_ANGAN
MCSDVVWVKEAEQRTVHWTWRGGCYIGVNQSINYFGK